MPVRQSRFAVRNSSRLPLKGLRRNHAVEATHSSLRPLGSAVILLLLLLALAFEGPPQGHAQAVWGSITGYVTDSSGAAVPQATVTVTAEDTGIETTVQADTAGFYNATHLNPGQYSVAVRMPGFNGFVREHVLLQVGASVRVDCPLKVGSASETVTVTAAPPILNTEKTDVNARFDAQMVDSFPVVGNNIASFIAWSPECCRILFKWAPAKTPREPIEPTSMVFGREPRCMCWMESPTLIMDSAAFR